MIQYRDALAKIQKIASEHLISSEVISLHDSLGRILDEDVMSPEQVPSFTNSSMDGFAIFAKDTVNASTSNPLRIKVNGMVAAGDLDAFKKFANQGPGIAVEIMTGAPVPQGGLDAIVKIEDVRVERDDDGTAVAIHLFQPSSSGDFIRPLGSDYEVGQSVLNKGIRISPEHILAASSLGISKVKVKKLPRIAIISTGSELVSPEEKTLEPGMIRNSTGPFLVAALKRMGFESKYLGVIQDDPELYRRTIQSALDEGAELILSTGAVSMGKFDFVTDVLKQMGAITHFHKVSIRPGKPLLFAEFTGKQKAVVFGVPGNPISTAVGLRFFIEPYLRSAMELPSEQPFKVKLAQGATKPEGLQCFFKAKTSLTMDGNLVVNFLKGQASYIVSALIDANSWVVFPAEGEKMNSGELVDVYPLQNSFESGVLS
jgi:molybdopterin molybdotransferase